MEWISSSETFVLGTFAEGPNGGADASHRGGNPGFVQAVDERTIVFPDYKVGGARDPRHERFRSDTVLSPLLARVLPSYNQAHPVKRREEIGALKLGKERVSFFMDFQRCAPHKKGTL